MNKVKSPINHGKISESSYVCFKADTLIISWKALTVMVRGSRQVILQSTLVISKSKAPSETLRDIRTSTYKMCRIEENTNRTTKFHKRTCNLTLLVSHIC